MLQQTFKRLSFLKSKDIFVATNRQYATLVLKQLPSLPEQNLIVEPALRDTGPCICFAAHKFAKSGFENEVMAVIYADHLIQNTDEFKKSLTAAAAYIKRTDSLSVIAVRAKYPNPNLGYIHIGHLREQCGKFELYSLDRFVEKPDAKTAKTFLESYRYLWNTGLYMWKVKTILEQFKKLAPEIYTATQKTDSFAKAPKISIDYAVIEKIAPREMFVIPADLGWNDIGNWQALYDELATKENGNVEKGNNLLLDTYGSVIFGNEKKLIATYGLKNMVIIDTPEALLVMPKEKAGEVKKIVEEIGKKGKEKYK